jgi:hypothetical protein
VWGFGREQLQRIEGLLPDSQGQNPVLTVLYVPYLLERGVVRRVYQDELGHPGPTRARTSSCTRQIELRTENTKHSTQNTKTEK